MSDFENPSGAGTSQSDFENPSGAGASQSDFENPSGAGTSQSDLRNHPERNAFRSDVDHTQINLNSPNLLLEDSWRELGTPSDFWLALWNGMILSPFILIVVCVTQTTIRQRYGILVGGNVGTMIYALGTLLFLPLTNWAIIIEVFWFVLATTSLIFLIIRYNKIASGIRYQISS